MRLAVIAVLLVLYILSVACNDDNPTLAPTISLDITKLRLFDLDSDPNETINLSSDSSYDDIKSYIQSRAEYWLKYEKSPWVAPEGTKKTVWGEQGGVVPWIATPSTLDNDDDRTIYPYSYDKAPHIVFVLIDDWGFNDFGRRSTYLSWTTPVIDSLSYEGINLENYQTYQTCSPSRGALLTGRYPLRLGLWETHDQAELPAEEITLAEELQASNYRTYIVGKWHLGASSLFHVPTRRGFDYFYGYYSSSIDYWTKTYNGYLDLHENDILVSNPAELNDTLHTGYLFQMKAEQVIKNHSVDYLHQPMFLYYSMQLVHSPWQAPEEYLSRCEKPTNIDESVNMDTVYNMCGMNLMLDAAIGNLTCALKKYGMADNTVLIIASDNGGDSNIPGNSFPFKGHKGSYYRGGVSASAIVHSKLIPKQVRGSSYHGLIHVTDWYPTIMGLATGGQWSPNDRSEKAVIDGIDVWNNLMEGSESPREEIVHFLNSNSAVIQNKNLKYFIGLPDSHPDEIAYKFGRNTKSIALTCKAPTIMESSLATFRQDSHNSHKKVKATTKLYIILYLGFAFAGIVSVITATNRATNQRFNSIAKDTALGTYSSVTPWSESAKTYDISASDRTPLMTKQSNSYA